MNTLKLSNADFDLLVKTKETIEIIGEDGRKERITVSVKELFHYFRVRCLCGVVYEILRSTYTCKNAIHCSNCDRYVAEDAGGIVLEEFDSYEPMRVKFDIWGS